MALSSRTRLLTLGLSAVLAVGVIGGATATLAQDPGGDRPPAGAEEGRRHHPRRLLGLTFKSIAANCDLTREELREGFLAGQSINQILLDQGSNPATCEADVLAAADTKLDELVAAGTITQERADQLYAKAQEALPKIMAHVPDPEIRPNRPAKPGASDAS